MKLAKFLTPQPPPSPSASFAAFGGALNKRKIYLSILSLIIVTLWNTHSVTAAPAKIDSLDSTFPLDLQPPIFEATAKASSPSLPNADNHATTVDSYGNLIESLKPIETPDGRKVVSAQGLQFEIPNYASGITELKKPSDDLLPPFVDPIVVALPNAGTSSSDETTSVDVENVPLVEVKSHDAELLNSKSTFFKVLPDYILEFNDPDIGGPVDYKPTQDKKGLSVIAWDLLPPLEVQEDSEKSISHSNKASVTTGHNLTAEASSHTSHKETTIKPNYTQNREESYYTTTSTTPRTTSTRRTKTTTTTPRTTTTLRTTTTPRTTTTTTRKTTTPRTTTTTTPEPDSSEFFKLEAGNSYTLPPWLQDIDDPELDVAVEYVVPEDINEYNHTISRDLLPPLEPYTDLNNVHLTPPPNYKEGTTTIRTTTTRKTTTPRTTAATTTTTRRPSTTIQAHWIRAKPTPPKPTIATFNNQFTSLSPSISLSTFAQRTTSTTTATTTTTVKPKTTINYYNRQLSSNTPQTDKIGSSSEEQINNKQTNPFLPASFDDGKYKPYSTPRRTVTTTTTTTTTPAPVVVDENPFAPTIPPWLKDFDYPDLAPGVPFIYDPNEDEYPVDKNILPPSKTLEDSNKSNPSSTSPFSNSQTPQGFTNKFTSSSTPLASSSSIPSIVTIPLPSTQTNQDDSTFTRPPPVFVPPPPTSEGGIIITNKADDITIKTSTTFNKNFAAPFDPATATISTTTTSDGVQKKVPLSADSESFPPFNNIITGSSTIPSKTTFTKSEDGKVITNNIFTSGSLGSTSAQPIGSSSQEKNAFTTQSFPASTFTKSTTASSVFKQFGTTSAGASGFGTSSGRPSSSDSSKYTGRFGGPPGVLAPQNTGFISSGTTVTKSYNKPALTTFEVSSSPGVGSNTNYKFTGSFGGPPGVLKPYDNVKNR